MSDSDDEMPIASPSEDGGMAPMPGGEPAPECPVPEADRGEDISAHAGAGGVYKRILVEGRGEETAPPGWEVEVHYTGKLMNGDVFDSSVSRHQTFKFELGKGRVIKAWDHGCASMKRGEKAILLCAPSYAYGASGSPPKIPGNSWLSFEVEMIDWQEPTHLMSTERKQEKASERKEAGNSSFKAGDFEAALKHYDGALSLLGAIYGKAANDLAETKAALHSNVAACSLKLARFDKARSAASEALKLQPRHTKAMFRRGVAQMELGELDASKEDLSQALQWATEANLENEVTAIRKEQARLKQKVAVEREREKKLFGGWLASKPSKTVSTAAAGDAEVKANATAGEQVNGEPMPVDSNNVASL